LLVCFQIFIFFILFFLGVSNFNVYKEIETVHTLLSQTGALDVLKDKDFMLATCVFHKSMNIVTLATYILKMLGKRATNVYINKAHALLVLQVHEYIEFFVGR
jgi:hypothetical protein